MESESVSDAFMRLVKIMDELRELCPWDRKQTIQTLRSLTIEELYELTDAVLSENWAGIKEELGDLFLHLLFYARIAREQEKFTLEEVLDGISEKLISRHPHIYGDVKVSNEEDVKRNWENLKLKEGKKSVLGGVPVSLPAVVKAIRLQEKAKQVGFEWNNSGEVWEKVEEETRELKEAEDSGDIRHIEEEFGDLMFSLINYARFLHIDAETALERTNRKFIDRFTKMEQAIVLTGKQMTDLSLGELDAVWNAVKKQKLYD
jgi:XTP/dITP diphosphohydrolase